MFAVEILLMVSWVTYCIPYDSYSGRLSPLVVVLLALVNTLLGKEIQMMLRLFLVIAMYRGFPPYAHFGTWKKLCYMKFVLVGLYCGPLLTLIPPLTRT